MFNRLLDLFIKLDLATAENSRRLTVSEQVNFLLENGVIAPPCSVGQTVYIIDEPDMEDPYVLDVEVSGVGYDKNGLWITLDLPMGFHQNQYIVSESIGKTVFLTEEEAERYLREIKFHEFLNTDEGRAMLKKSLEGPTPDFSKMFANITIPKIEIEDGKIKVKE